jgi:hypothetical protein
VKYLKDVKSRASSLTVNGTRKHLVHCTHIWIVKKKESRASKIMDTRTVRYAELDKATRRARQGGQDRTGQDRTSDGYSNSRLALQWEWQKHRLKGCPFE